MKVGQQLKQMRERADVSRYYIARYINMNEYELARIECGYVEPDENIINGYHKALEYLRKNSLPDRARFKLLWSAPKSTDKEVKG